MLCDIAGIEFEGTRKECLTMMEKVNRHQLKKAGLWWEEDEIKYKKRRVR